MSSSKQGQPRVPPLTQESPLTFRPHLAARVGQNEAIALEVAHVRQQTHGEIHRVRHCGALVELLCFFWPFDARRGDFPHWSERTVRRVTDDLLRPAHDSTSNPDAAGLLSEGQPLLWQFSVRVAGRVSKDWYSVNYAAVGDSSQLFPAAAVDRRGVCVGGPKDQGPKDRPDWPKQPANLTAGIGQPDRAQRPSWPLPLGGKGGEDQGPSSSSIQSAQIQERARALASGGGTETEDAAAIDALLRLGMSACDALDLLEQYAPGEGARRARVMGQNVSRLIAAGFKFDKSAKAYAIAGVRKNWHHLSDEEVAGRVAWQRQQRRTARRPAGENEQTAGGAGDFNVRPAGEVQRDLQEDRRNRELERTIDELSDQQWQTIAERLAPQWAASCPGKAFPADSRRNAIVRALAKAYLREPAPQQRGIIR